MQPGHSYITASGDRIIRVLSQNSASFVCVSYRSCRGAVLCMKNEKKKKVDSLSEFPDRDSERINSLFNDIFNALDRLRLALVENSGPISTGTIFANSDGIIRVEKESEQEIHVSSIAFFIAQNNCLSIKEAHVRNVLFTYSKEEVLRDYVSYTDPTHAYDRFRKIFSIANLAILSIMDDLYKRYVPEDKRTPRL